jgi:4-hydroxybenzoate polyprenyltransferase
MEPESWPTWLQVPLLILLVLGAALAWFTTGYGGLLVAGFGLLVVIYLRFKHSDR